MMFWRPVDWVGGLIQERFTPQWQMRVGVILTLGALVMHALGPVAFRSEPPGIYQSSQAALTITGLTLVFQARQAAVIEDTGDDVDTHREATEP